MAGRKTRGVTGEPYDPRRKNHRHSPGKLRFQNDLPVAVAIHRALQADDVGGDGAREVCAGIDTGRARVQTVVASGGVYKTREGDEYAQGED